MERNTTPPDDAPSYYYIPAAFYVRTTAHVIDRLILYAFAFSLRPALRATAPGQEYSPVGIWTILFIITTVVYLLLATRSQTVGKYLTRCHIVNEDGTPTSFARTLSRETFGKLISSLLIVGYIWAYFNDDQQTIHDKIMKTYVVDISSTAQAYTRRAVQRRRAQSSQDDD